MLNGLNLLYQGKGKQICDMYSYIKAFEVKSKFSPISLLCKASQLRNPWPTEKSVKCWRQSLMCDSVSFVSTLKESAFSRTPLLPTLMKPCLLISLSWLIYTTVIYWKMHLSPSVSLTSVLPSLTRHTQTSKGMQWKCPHFLAAHITVRKPFEIDENSNDIKTHGWTSASVFETGCDRNGTWQNSHQPEASPQFTLINVHK